MLTGQNGILNRTAEAKEKTEKAQRDEEEKMHGYESTIDQYVYGVPEGLKVGTTVTYSPSGTYNWQAKYCSTTQTDDVTLSSANGESFNLTEWKVLSIENGRVELVSTKPTDGTVYLGQTQGYNNGVKLLNDACNRLYSNNSKGITARSLNIEDIEKYMYKEKLIEVHEYQNADGGVKYGTKIQSAYTEHPKYPTIYLSEKLSVIDGTEKTNGLEMSKQTVFIEPQKNNGANDIMMATISIQPYQSYWYKDNTYMQIAFKTVNDDTDYYNLLMPNGSSTNYWLASRCINTGSNYIDFNMRQVYRGCVNANSMYDSNDSTNKDFSKLFPVVSLDSSLISGDSINGFFVN